VDTRVSETQRQRLLRLINDLAVVRGRVTLSSGKEADYYIDLRRITLHHEAAPLVGAVMLEHLAQHGFGGGFDAIGGLTLGADPIATAVLHAAAARGENVDAFVVRKAAKAHGMQKQIEGPDIKGRRVVIVEDTTTTGSSPLAAIQAAREAGAEVLAVATIVDRDTGAREVIEAEGVPYFPIFGLPDLQI
jgi:orotate phosphoribosyltransferase